MEGGSIVGHVRLHEAFPSTVLGNQRNLIVYLPPSYARSPRRRYPVLYLQDGQNVFDFRTSAFGMDWGLDDTAERLIAEGAIEELIMVGVYNTPARMAEYTPAWSDRPDTGRIEDYAQFLLDEVKPFIDRTYRTEVDRDTTGILGSSLGGFCSLYLSLRYPHVFGRAAAVSPSLWFGQGGIMRWIAGSARLEGPERLWICAGTLEGRPAGSTFSYAIEGIRRLRDLLLERGYEANRNLFYHEAEGGRHDEKSWGARADRILRALYPLAS